MASAYLDAQVASFPEMEEHFVELKNLFTQKLYHQLSQKLQECLRIPFFQANDTLLLLYENFVKEVEKHIDFVDLAIFAKNASRQCSTAQEGLDYLEKIEETVKDNNEAWLIVHLERAQFQLDMKPPSLESAKEKIDKAREVLDRFGGMRDIVHSAFYRVCLLYHKIVGTPSDYFQNALMFLSYTKLEEIPESDRLTLASDIATAALIGEVYNFGELLQHPILQCLKGTNVEWLGTLLFAFNDGDIQGLEDVFRDNPDTGLNTHRKKLDQKIRYMKLIDMIFRRPTHDRSLSFDEIREGCRLRTNEDVEFLLMESMCLELIKGIIDEVSQVVEVSWIQPRMLNNDQLAALRHRLGGWSNELVEVVKFLQIPRDK